MNLCDRSWRYKQRIKHLFNKKPPDLPYRLRRSRQRYFFKLNCSRGLCIPTLYRISHILSCLARRRDTLSKNQLITFMSNLCCFHRNTTLAYRIERKREFDMIRIQFSTVFFSGSEILFFYYTKPKGCRRR